MAKLEFIDNNKDPRYAFHPKGTLVRWHHVYGLAPVRSALVVVVAGYSVCTLVRKMCKSCMNEGFQLDTEDGKKYCGGWYIHDLEDVEERTWWERTI